MRWAGREARLRGGRGAYRVLVRNPEGKRQVERPCRRWYNIKMYVKEISLVWAGLYWRVLINVVIHL
jgi:hypothetical protein